MVTTLNRATNSGGAWLRALRLAILRRSAFSEHDGIPAARDGLRLPRIDRGLDHRPVGRQVPGAASVPGHAPRARRSGPSQHGYLELGLGGLVTVTAVGKLYNQSGYGQSGVLGHHGGARTVADSSLYDQL